MKSVCLLIINLFLILLVNNIKSDEEYYSCDCSRERYNARLEYYGNTCIGYDKRYLRLSENDGELLSVYTRPILNNNGNLVGVAVSSISTPFIIDGKEVIPQNINFGVKSETLSNFLKANNIKYNSNDKSIEESDNLALQSTVQLNCYNTLREARKLKEQGLVRNILED
jgi:hypothetical protein